MQLFRARYRQVRGDCVLNVQTEKFSEAPAIQRSFFMTYSSAGVNGVN